jgi:hypothetical protein
LEFMSSPSAKNISLVPSGKSPPLVLAIPSRERGVGHRHERWGRDAVDAAASGARLWSQGEMNLVSDRCAQDERRICVRQSRVVLAPVPGVKSAQVLASRPGAPRPSIRRRR